MSSGEKLIAIVTGSAQGIGLAIAETLLKNGYKVCLADINPLKGQKTRDALSEKFGKDNVIFMTCDVSKETHHDSMFVEVLRLFKRIDIFVNNAAILCEDDVEKTLMVNLAGPIYGCQAALKYMGKDCGGAGGNVINVASVSGLLPSIYAPVYCSSKHGVVGLTRSLGTPHVLERSGIRFNAICPAYVLTDMQDTFQDLLPESFGDVKKRDDMMQPTYVSEGVLKLIEENPNGATLVVSKFRGFEYVGHTEQLEKILSDLQ